MGDRFKRWWAEQGATYNERRRKRYAEDPDYRARARGQSKPPRPSAPESEWTSQTVFTASGAPLTVFSVAALAAATGASHQTLRGWTRQKKISPPDHTAPSGAKFYTRETIAKIVEEVRAAGLSVRARRDDTREVKVRLRTGEVHTLTLHPVSDLASVLQRRVTTVERWERLGLIPETPFRLTSLRRRYYTSGQIKAAATAFKAVTQDGPLFREGTEGAELFKKRLQEAWEPLNGAEVCDE